MHAVLCRNWQKRVKGRDWYDLVWYLQNDVPLNLPHLQERMRQTKHLQQEEKFGKEELFKRLHKKIAEIDWKSAQSDVAVFIADKRKLDLWSKQFFLDMIAHLKIYA